MNKNIIKKIVIVVVLVGLVAVFKFLNLDQYLTLTYIKESQERFAHLYAQHQLLVIGAYMAMYILVTTLSLPGAAVMTLAGGALFGFIVGTVVISFASTIGATLACFVARFLLQEWVQKKVGGRISKFNEGIQKEGAFYLFTLRLIPIFPFWLINLAMGLTKMHLWTFYWISQVGMLPGTMVYVNAGKELAKIDSLAGILSPTLILSFVLLGLFPITVKKIMALYRLKTGKSVANE